MSLILDGTNGVSDIDGSAATPAIRGTDTNTGIFFPAADTIAFAEGGTEVARFDSAGNLGIGTTTPNGKLTSQTATSSTSAFTFATQLNNSFGSNESIAALGFHNRADVNSNGVGAAIALSGGGVSAGSGNIVFCIKGTGNIATAVVPSDEKMRITSGGSLLIGTTNENGRLYAQGSDAGNTFGARNTNASFAATIAFFGADRNTTNNSFYFIDCYNFGSSTYKFRVADSGNVTNTNNSYGAISDIKLKDNVVDASPKLEDLCKVKVRQYNLKSDPNHKQIGVVAQELEEVFAGLVETVDDKDIDGNDLGTTTKQVKYSVFVPMLIKAIQEIKVELDIVKAELATLKAPL